MLMPAGTDLMSDRTDDGARDLCITLIGPPGAGKGTLAWQLQDKLHLVHLSTGDMIRAEIAEKTEIGRLVESVIAKGGMLDDTVAIGLVEKCLNNVAATRGKSGFVLDGVPRTLSQAKMLDDLLAQKQIRLQHAINLKVEERHLMPRIAGRLVHPATGRTYHDLWKPPKHAMLDDITGEQLIRRSDDRFDILKNRLEAYHKDTAEVISYYDMRGLLRVVDANQPPDEVSSCVLDMVLNQ